ncbi:MAG: DsbA family protein [Rhodobacteraceae bacterium]|nr:MAG: DsbA family protein [Paracoccaceae bacterium]
MKKYLPAIILAAVAAVGAGWYLTQGSPAGTDQSLSVAQSVPATEIHPLDIPLGNPDASVVMVEFSSFTCPHCATFHANVFPQIKQDFIDNGDILYLKREVFFDRFGLWAALVARCGGTERYHGIVDLIYQTQSTWAGSSDPSVVATNLRRLGRQAGLDEAEVEACLADEQKALELTEFYRVNAETYGINSTPSFVIDGQRYSNMAAADFTRILNEKLGR